MGYWESEDIMAENPFSSEILTGNVLKVLVAIVLIAVILVPLVDGLTKTTHDVEEINTGSSGLDLAYYDVIQSGVSSTVNVEVSGDTLIFTGNYVKTIPLSDMVVMITDKTSAYVKGNALHYYDGEDHVVTNLSLVLSNHTVNGEEVAWAYFPTTNGVYSSYNAGYEYRLSDAVSIGNFAGVTTISKENDVTESDLDGIYAHVQKTDKGVSGIIYDAKESVEGE